MFGQLRFRSLVLIIITLLCTGQATLPVQAAGKTVPKIAFVLYNRTTQMNTLSIADPDGRNIVDLFKDGHFFSPVWSPDGKRLAFAGTKYDSLWEIYLVNSDGSNLQKISAHTGGNQPGSVTWSPDGTQLIYSVFDGVMRSFYRINADGSDEHKLSFKDIIFGGGRVAWSADGKQVAAIWSRSSTFQIILADTDGENIKPLPIRSKIDRGIVTALVWLPDKQHILVYEWPSTTESAPSELYIADFDGSNAKVILKSPKLPRDINSVSVSPDGKQLVFVASEPGVMGRNSQLALWAANIDGSGLRALVLRGLAYDAGTSWGLIPQDALPKGTPISFAEVVK